MCQLSAGVPQNQLHVGGQKKIAAWESSHREKREMRNKNMRKK